MKQNIEGKGTLEDEDKMLKRRRRSCKLLEMIQHAAHRGGGALRAFRRNHLGDLVTKMARGPQAKDA